MTQMPGGWFPDPRQAGELVYWDGSAWTDQRMPAVSYRQPLSAQARQRVGGELRRPQTRVLVATAMVVVLSLAVINVVAALSR